MHEFVKNILNYFAAFTETRFSSRNMLNYKWLNDENLTLDLTFFKEFREHIITKLESSNQSPIIIKPLQYKGNFPIESIKENDFPQVYTFDLLTPSQYKNWFENLRNGEDKRYKDILKNNF